MQQDLASPGAYSLSCVPPESCPPALTPMSCSPLLLMGTRRAFSEEKDWVLLHRGYFILPDFDVKIKT